MDSARFAHLSLETKHEKFQVFPGTKLALPSQTFHRFCSLVNHLDVFIKFNFFLLIRALLWLHFTLQPASKARKTVAKLFPFALALPVPLSADCSKHSYRLLSRNQTSYRIEFIYSCSTPHHGENEKWFLNFLFLSRSFGVESWGGREKKREMLIWFGKLFFGLARSPLASQRVTQELSCIISGNMTLIVWVFIITFFCAFRPASAAQLFFFTFSHFYISRGWKQNGLACCLERENFSSRLLPPTVMINGFSRASDGTDVEPMLEGLSWICPRRSTVTLINCRQFFLDVSGRSDSKSFLTLNRRKSN